MIILILIAYLLIGTFFMGLLTDSAGNTFGGMVVLWPVIVPILAVAKLFDIVFQIGDKLSRKF